MKKFIALLLLITIGMTTTLFAKDNFAKKYEKASYEYTIACAQHDVCITMEMVIVSNVQRAETELLASKAVNRIFIDKPSCLIKSKLIKNKKPTQLRC